MEECDVQLLLLGKLCKGSLDLPRWVSSRVDRDFRIDQNAIAGCQEHSRGLREKRKRKGKAGSGPASKKKSSTKASFYTMWPFFFFFDGRTGESVFILYTPSLCSFVQGENRLSRRT